MMKINHKIRWLYLSIAVIILTGMILFLLIWNGVVLLNNPSREQYPVRGVDVSSYQGEIDWAVLSTQDIEFAFIKATEGSSYADERFAYNYEQARRAGLRVGAYHFFSYDSPGEAQADNFIGHVEVFDGMLPPVIDVEFYGDKERNLPDKDRTRRELDALIGRLTEHYGLKPIIYATEKSYDLYIAGSFADLDIWIRNVITSPRLSDGREWTFWQYTNRAVLDGYIGTERYIDLNVFCGSRADFLSYGETNR